MVNTIPFQRRALALFQGKKTYQEVSEKQWTLCPRESYASPPAIYLEKDIDKIIDVAETTTYAEEIRRIQGGMREHGATIAYKLRNAYVLDGYVYKNSMKHQLVTTPESLIGKDVTHYIPEAALACSFIGNRYFGDWIINDVSLNLAARELAEPITVNHHLSKQQVEYSHLFDIYATLVHRVKCGELIIIDDAGQNSFRRKRFEQMRSQIWKIKPAQQNIGVMLLRGTSGSKRLLVNEGEIAEYLRSLGFSIIDPLKLSATEVIQQTIGAKMVIGVCGSQLAPGLLSLADSGTILCLQPPSRVDNCYKIYADLLGLNYAFIVGDQVDDSFKIEIKDLDRILERIPA
jgi:hypothetical protein